MHRNLSQVTVEHERTPFTHPERDIIITTVHKSSETRNAFIDSTDAQRHTIKNPEGCEAQH